MSRFFPLILGIISFIFISSASWEQGRFKSLARAPRPEPVSIRLPTIPKSVDEKLIQFAYQQCMDNSVPFLLFLKLVELESGWDIDAINYNHDKRGRVKSFDVGICQINSKNFILFKKLYHSKDRAPNSYNITESPYDNIEMGVKHLRDLFNEFSDWKSVIAAYNCGGTAVHRNRIPNSTKVYLSRIIPCDYWWNYPLFLMPETN